MSNTIIQIKRSGATATPANGSLTAGELAYSYNSDKLFIGSSDGTTVSEVGGKYWLNHTLNAFNRANTGGSGSNAAFAQANVSASLANGAAALANTHAANLSSAIAANAAAGNAYTSTVGASANALALYLVASANAYSDFVGESSNTYASNEYFSKSGGNIGGDVSIEGSLSVTGTLTYVNTQILSVGDAIITLNGDLPGNMSPTENAGLEVNRGNLQGNASLLWVESQGRWGFTSNNSSPITNYIASNTELDLVIGSLNSNWNVTNTVYDIANVANALVSLGNTYIESFVSSANNYSVYIGASGNSYTNYIAASINSWSTTVSTAGNNYTDYVNTRVTTTTTAGNNYAVQIGTAGNNYVNAYVSAANTNIFNTFSNAANLISGTVPSARISGNYSGITGVGTITSGTWQGNAVEVFYGGTGVTQFANNGVLFGNTAGSLRVASATLEGQVLQASAVGTPEFAMLDGGAF
jgi:hypothetical protein